MQKSKISLVVLLGLAAIVTSMTGCGRKGLINVNGEKVQKDEFYARLENVPVQTPQGVKLAGQYVVEQIIGEKLVTQLANKGEVAPTEAQINKKISYIRKENGGNLQKMLASQGMTMDDLKHKITVEQAFINLATKGVDVPETDVKKAYMQALNAPNSQLKRPAQVKTSAILCNSKEDADKAYKLLSQGNEFSSVAMQLSVSPTKQNQGFIGWVSSTDTPRVVSDAVWALQTNQYSKPIKLDPQVAQAIGGQYLIVMAGQKRPEKVKTYNELKDMIREQLEVGKGMRTNNVAEKVQRFTKDANITINAERYKKLVENMKKDATETLKQLTGTTPAGTPAP